MDTKKAQQIFQQQVESLNNLGVETKPTNEYKTIEGDLYVVFSIECKDTDGTWRKVVKNTVKVPETAPELKLKLEQQKTAVQSREQDAVSKLDEFITQVDQAIVKPAKKD